MKIKKAEAYLNRVFKPMVQTQNKVKAYHRDNVNKAVELAEQEAEERMREKSIRAFKSSCKYQEGCLGANGKCDPTQCEDLASFIEKLTEK